jgi:hypothetical protein
MQISLYFVKDPGAHCIASAFFGLAYAYSSGVMMAPRGGSHAGLSEEKGSKRRARVVDDRLDRVHRVDRIRVSAPEFRLHEPGSAVVACRDTVIRTIRPGFAGAACFTGANPYGGVLFLAGQQQGGLK